MTSELQAIFRRVAKQASVAAHRRCAWVEIDELMQEAWVAMLAALPRYDPALGDLGGYLYSAAYRAAFAMGWRQGSSLSVRPRNAADLPGLVQAAQRASVLADEVALPQEASTPEARVEAMQGLARVRALLLDLVAVPAEADAVLEVLAGRASAEVAQAYALPLPQLYRTTFRARRALEAAYEAA